MVYPLNNSNKMENAKNNIINILKMEGYKLNSGELFVAFKEAGGEMEDFKGALEELTEEEIYDEEEEPEPLLEPIEEETSKKW